MKKITLFFLLSYTIITAQITTSSLVGKITDGSVAIPDALITLTYSPNNLNYQYITDKSGRFNFTNLKVGGPYSITISAADMEDYYIGSFQLVLGDNDLGILTMERYEMEGLLEEVVLMGSRSNSNTNFGKNITRKQINGMPTINRAIQDVTKLTPQSANNSFAGTNFRYNNVTIDGAINNDAIGFSPSLGGQSSTSGMPGSSTRSNSISLDAIQDIQVYIAPYDVKLGNFLGGSVNAVTRSGSNDVTGSVYGYGRNALLTGPNNAGDGSKMPSSFEDYQLGFRVGFPILKDKVFFFTNMELTKRNDPVFYNSNDVDASGNRISLIDQATAQSIRDFVQKKYDFDVGSYNYYTNYSKSEKIFNKVDWEINNDNSISIRNNIVYSEASNLERDAANFRFSNFDFIQKNVANSTVLDFKSRITSNLSNSFVAGYSKIKDYRVPTSDNFMFPTVEISHNGGTIFLGNDREATLFNMKQNTIEITDNLTYNIGNHTLLFGTHNELYNINYGFVNALQGRISYRSLDDFYASSPNRVRGTYSFNDLTRDELFNDPYAKFKVNMYSLYFQDEISINDHLKITPGIRVDYTHIPTKPTISPEAKNSPKDPYFGTTYSYTPINEINNSFLNRPAISPRFGFVYNILKDRSIVLRGGSGVFTGRIPFAWLGYAFCNDGVGFGSYDKNNLTGSNELGDPLYPRGLINYQDRENPKTQLDLIDNNFKIPQVLRSSLAIDYNLEGYKFTLEGIYTTVIQDLKFQQINLVDNPTYYSYDKDKQMPIYTKGDTGKINSDLSNAYLLSNTTKGYRYNITAQVSKYYNIGFDVMAAYTYGQSKDISNGVRNSMESNWQMNQSLTPNDPQLATSNFDIKHRIMSNLGYTINLSQNNRIITNLFFNAQSGNPFTWGFINSNIANTPQATGLAYIPKDADETLKYMRDRVVSGVVVETAAEQAAEFEQFINKNKYLRSRRGTFTERNADRTPWNIQADLKITDEINIKNSSQSIQISLTIINLGNLISKEWGRSYFVPNTFNSTASIGLTRVGDDDLGDPTYNFNTPSSPYSIDQFASRFQAQLGLRYSF